uniref:Uncharacterized protein n=1 Tax=Anguilla anguilla TaxID=7936 RepID=A0A0E9VPF8_ANGAN
MQVVALIQPCQVRRDVGGKAGEVAQVTQDHGLA